MNLKRRSFMRYACLAAAGNLAGLRPFGVLNALAQSSPGYKALVCVFLYGGNDGNNMVVPFDTAGHAAYAANRGPLALQQSALLQLSRSPEFAFHGSLPGLRSLYDQGSAAVVANVGNLVQPLTRSAYLSGANAPASLFSHDDQQNEWQNAAADGSVNTGWAGRISDALQATYNSGASIPLVTALAGDPLFGNGSVTSPMSVAPGNLGNVDCFEGAQICTLRGAALQSLIQLSSGVSLVTAQEGIITQSFQYGAALAAATAGAPSLSTTFPSTSLGAQLQQVAQLMQVRSNFGVQRQIFFCGLSSFDTHSSQLSIQAPLLQQVSDAMAAFYQATAELGIQNDVTTFTMSDFARALQPNSVGGTDHGWGSHHIVMGGAVKGGNIYGTFPTLALGGPDDSGSSGRWIPTTSTVQYAATLAQWFGVPQTELTTIFPNIGAFNTANLGFV
jgi:uncharacterized protein (DUF1501 family)